MSLFPAVVELLEREAQCKAAGPEALLIGHQQLYKFDGYGLFGFLEWAESDIDLFKRLGAVNTKVLDVSDYDGADIVHDLCDPLPAELHNVADFIYDGSCMDNIWDVPQAMRSLHRMLRPNGRLFLINHGTMIQSAYSVYSPEWYFNFFALNGYDACRVYIFNWDNWAQWQWFAFDCSFNPIKHSIGYNHMIVVIADKGATHIESSKAPIQAQYREIHGTEHDPFLELYKRTGGYPPPPGRRSPPPPPEPEPRIQNGGE